jgi:hypothetical protein
MTKKSLSGGLMKNLLIATILLAGFSGCALLRSQVAVLHQLPKDLSGTTYVMIPFKEQKGSLEHKAYEEAVRQELNAKGFHETTEDQAQTLVFLAYGIDTGKGLFRLIQSSAKPESKPVPPLMEGFKATAAALGPPTGLWKPGRQDKLSTRVS